MYGVGMSVRKVMRSSDRRIAATVASTLGSVGTAMCGICGMAGREDLGLCWEMTRRMRHRGPDGEGVRGLSASDDRAPAALGHRRLAILDPTERGAQPMAD